VEYLLKQSGGEPLPLLNEAEEAEGEEEEEGRDDQTAEGQLHDDEGMVVPSVESVPSEDLATFAGEEDDNDNLCEQEVEVCAVVRSNMGGEHFTTVAAPDPDTRALHRG